MRETERRRKGEESTATEKVEGREKTQLSPGCSPAHPAREDSSQRRLTPFNESWGVRRAETGVCP